MSSSKSFIWGASQSCPCCETATLAFKLKSSVEEVPADKVNFTCISWTFLRYPALQSIIAGCDGNIMSFLASSIWQLLREFVQLILVYSSKCLLCDV